MTAPLRFSRIDASAKELGGEDFDPDRFADATVLLTGTAALLSTANGAEMARCALLLLMRIARRIVVALPGGFEPLAEELRDWAQLHAWDDVPEFTSVPDDLSDFAAILSIGGTPSNDLPLTIIVANGWSVGVTSTLPLEYEDFGSANPVAALAAASLGVGEVFKRLLCIRDDAGQYLDGCHFSLWTYAADKAPGPPLPPKLKVDLLVAGGGAIGNGVAHLLTRLPLEGHCLILDRQTYGEENWGTCLRLTRADAKSEKAPFLAGLFSGALKATPFKGDIENFEAEIGKPPPIVLSGFDNIEARHAVQDLWPDIIIDGAIGRRLECQVSAHPWDSNIACLRCLFELPPGEASRAVQQRASGLTADAIGDPHRLLTLDDVAQADPERQEWLLPQVGRPICSVLENASALSRGDIDENFRPSVPFVAAFSAAMMVTELVRYLTTGSTAVEPRFFFSLLWGPSLGDHYAEDRKASCLCVTRAGNIERFRQARQSC